MGRVALVAVNESNVYACDKCRAHLASYRNLVSKSFAGATGRAFLFDAV